MHNFKYALKTLFRKKMLIFWTYAFPIILALLFNFAFSGIESEEQLNVIDIAIVNNESYTQNEYYKNSFDVLSNDSSKNKLFNIKYVSEKNAKNLLKDKKITGYIDLSEEKNIYVNSNGYKETVIKLVVDELSLNEKMINDIIENEMINTHDNDINNIYLKAINIINEATSNNNTKDVTTGKLSYTMVEFYTLIAMTCLYGGTIGAAAINQNLANMSNNGKRIAISPVSKAKIVTSSVCASYIVELIGVALLFLFTTLVLKIDYGNNLPLIILTSIIGTLAGLSLGIFVATIFKKNEASKTGIIIAITMLFSFLSGMMGIGMKYIIDTNLPIINKINPANMITDALYSLYYYQTLNRYWFDIISLLVFSLILIIISIIKLRGQKYDNI